MLILLNLCILISVSTCYEIGLVNRNQDENFERDFQLLTGRGSMDPFSVPLAPRSIMPIELQPVPFVNYLNPVLQNAAIGEDSSDLAGKAGFFNIPLKNHMFDDHPLLHHMSDGHKMHLGHPMNDGLKMHVPSKPMGPTWLKKITFASNQEPPKHSKPAPEWNFKVKLPDFMSHFHKKVPQHQGHDEVEAALTAECNEVGGKIILGSCYKYFANDLEYSEARIECQKKGADLWTPDLRNPFLLHFLAIAIPEIASAPSEELWLGAVETNGRIITVDGEDISDAILVLPDEGDVDPEGECVTMEFETGAIFHNAEDCENSFNYICEYPLRSQQPVNVHKLVKF